MKVKLIFVILCGIFHLFFFRFVFAVRAVSMYIPCSSTKTVTLTKFDCVTTKDCRTRYTGYGSVYECIWRCKSSSFMSFKSNCQAFAIPILFGATGICKTIPSTYPSGWDTNCTASSAYSSNPTCNITKSSVRCSGEVTIINGACGDSNGGTFASQNEIVSTCASGSVSWLDNIGTDGTFNWSCSGSGGGTTAFCSANINNGICDNSLNTCIEGTVLGIGETELFNGGIYNVWHCGSVKCTSIFCSSVNGINTMCTGDRQCANGITASNVTEDNVDHIWDCVGTFGSCNGLNGTSQTGCRYPIVAESWFQTVNGGVLGKSTITNFVPTTCGLSTNGCVEATSIGGLVAAPAINGFDNVDYSSPNNWHTNTSIVNQIDFFGKYKNITGVGTTLIEGNLSDSNIINNTNGLLMVDGNVTISQNKTTPIGNFSMIVASGDITIDPSVTRFDGILAGNNIDIGGSNATQLTINGSLYGTNQVNITRSYVDKIDNNDSPAVVVSFRPDFIFNMPTSMAKNVVDWKWGN